jgi:glycosyltransferase involved in cell wall biosynthesis
VIKNRISAAILLFMIISGFTYVRNGFTYGYPFIQSIQSLLPLVDELIVVVGNSTDNTREAIVNLNNPKIKIIDTIWDENIRTGGKIFALQSNIGIENIKGDWAIHLQVDEILHENDYEKILNSIKKADLIDLVDGIIFPFYHFWGDYNHIRTTRKTHRYEIRAFKNRGCIRAYRDSQGFRKYTCPENYNSGEKGIKLNVIKSNAYIYHYSYSRNPKLMQKKDIYFKRFWHSDEYIKLNPNNETFDYNKVDKLDIFKGSHPKIMEQVIKNKDWNFVYDPSKSNMKFKHKILFYFEKYTGYRLFEYKNYKLLKIKNFPADS